MHRPVPVRIAERRDPFVHLPRVDRGPRQVELTEPPEHRRGRGAPADRPGEPPTVGGRLADPLGDEIPGVRPGRLGVRSNSSTEIVISPRRARRTPGASRRGHGWRTRRRRARRTARTGGGQHVRRHPGFDRGDRGPPALAGIRDVLVRVREVSVAVERRRGEVEEPRGHDAAAAIPRRRPRRRPDTRRVRRTRSAAGSDPPRTRP